MKPVMRNPDPDHASANFAGRRNLAMRMRRFTRLTDAFGGEPENHARAVAVYPIYLNRCRVPTLCVTPATEAGPAGHVWSVEESAAILGRYDARGRRTGPGVRSHGRPPRLRSAASFADDPHVGCPIAVL